MTGAALAVADDGVAPARAERSVGGLWNLSFGFFGIQIGFALQNANMSRIFQTLGTSIDDLPLLWIAAPLTGLLVQPLVGHFSDRTWTRLGRRRPYFLVGALLSALALVLMPNAGGLLAAAALLWLLDASLNTTMEPFRAFVGDMLPPRQRAAGYAFQTGFIGAGAVAASLAPTLLHDVFGLANTASPGEVPSSVRWAFYLGAGALLLAVLWTVLTTHEHPPEAPLVREEGGAAATIWRDFRAMPRTMRQLAAVQFFTWSALFVMWIFLTPVVAQNVFGSSDPASTAYNAGADWVGVLFAVYNGVAALAAFVLPALARRFGRGRTHSLALLAGAAGFASVLIARDPNALLVSMALVGLAWASILTLPYAILCDALPSGKFGVYMGLFNIFIVLPQLVVSGVMGWIVRTWFPDNPAPAFGVAAALLLLAAGAMALFRPGEATRDG